MSFLACEQPQLIARCRWCHAPLWRMPDGTVRGPVSAEYCLCESEDAPIEMEIDLDEEVDE